MVIPEFFFINFFQIEEKYPESKVVWYEIPDKIALTFKIRAIFPA